MDVMMEAPETKKCRHCHVQDSHPSYDDWCEDCYAEVRLTKMYGRKYKDRSVRGAPKIVRDLDLGFSGDTPFGR